MRTNILHFEPAAFAFAEQLAADLPGVTLRAPQRRLIVPRNCVEIVERRFRAAGLSATWSQRVGSVETALRWSTEPLTDPEDLAVYTKAGLPPPAQRFRIRGAPGLRPVVRRPGDEVEFTLDRFFAPFQAEGIVKLAQQGFGLLRWGTGAGKGVGALCLGLSVIDSPRVVLVTRATNRIGLAREARRYTEIEPTVLAGMTATSINPANRILILGWETIPAWAAAIIYAGPYVVIFDEIHKCISRKRYSTYEDGTGKHVVRNNNITSAAMDLSRNAVARYATTATPINDRAKDLYIPFDLLEPGGWGTAKGYLTRYCNGHINIYGGFEAKGAPVGELKAELAERVAAIVHDVPEAVSEAQLPGADIIFTALSKEDQCGAAAFAAELKQAHRAGAEQVERSLAMQAATRKRPFILDRAEEIVESGGRYIVFTGRKVDAERLAADVRARFKSIAGLKDVPVYMLHGEISQKQRQAMIDEYATVPVAVLVGTSDSIGESINGLQCTHWATLAMMPNSPGALKQIRGRLIRWGQAQRTTLELLWAEGNEYDEKAVQRLLNKLPALREIVGDTSMTEVEHGFRGDVIAQNDALWDKLMAAPADDTPLNSED